MNQTGEVGLVAGEGKERGHARLPNQHGHVPSLIGRTDQAGAARTEKQDIAATLTQVGQCMLDIAVEGIRAADRYCWRESGVTRIIGDLPEPQQIEHDDSAGPLALHLCRHGWLAWGEQVEIRQGAEIGRPSTLFARADGSADAVERLIVGGSAVTVARGEFSL